MTECLQIVEWLKNWFTKTEDLVDVVYPIGAIYMSVNSTNPSTLFGGTWQRLEETFLYATSGTADTGYQATDGEATHTLTEAELPYIEGTFPHMTYGEYKVSGHTIFESGGNTHYEGQTSSISNNSRYKFRFGNNQPHNNMPPHMKVYMWKRTA